MNALAIPCPYPVSFELKPAFSIFVHYVFDDLPIKPFLQAIDHVIHEHNAVWTSVQTHAIVKVNVAHELAYSCPFLHNGYYIPLRE